MRIFRRGESPPDSKPEAMQEAIPEDWTGRRVKIKGTNDTGTVVGPAIEKSRTGGTPWRVKGEWFLRIDGMSGENYRYAEDELEQIQE